MISIQQRTLKWNHCVQISRTRCTIWLLAVFFILCNYHSFVHGQEARCRECCKSNLFSGRLTCCENEQNCVGMPCCDYDSGFKKENLWSPCLSFLRCQRLNPNGMCTGQNTQIWELGSNFQCKDQCCNSFVTLANTWKATVNNTPGQEFSQVSLVLDPIEYKELLLSPLNLPQDAQLRQIVVRVPSGWKVRENSKCLFQVDGAGSQPLECPTDIINGEKYILIHMNSLTPQSAFTVNFTHVSTPSGLTANTLTSFHLLFDQDRVPRVFSSYLRLEPLTLGIITGGLFYPKTVFPKTEGDAVLRYKSAGDVPMNGFLKATFPEGWKFKSYTKWNLLEKDGQRNVENATFEESSNTWTLQIPNFTPSGWVSFVASNVISPENYEASIIKLTTFNENMQRIDEGPVSGSPATSTGAAKQSPSPYNYVSIVIFMISFLFCAIVTRTHGLNFSRVTIWNDLTAVCALLSLSIDIVNNIVWILHRNSFFYYVVKARLCVTFTMLLAVCFHWGTVLLLKLRKVPHIATVIAFVILCMAFYAFQIVVSIANSDDIERVYEIELRGDLLSCKKDLDIGDNINYRYSDIQGYLWECYLGESNSIYLFSIATSAIFCLLTILVMALGCMVLKRGKRLLDTTSGQQHLYLTQALRLYYSLIGVVTATYVVSWILQITGEKIQYPWWYIFVVWLPFSIPPCCLVFLQWNSAASTLRGSSNESDEISNYDEIRTPSIRFSDADQWSYHATDSFIGMLNNQNLYDSSNLGAKQIGLSLKMITENKLPNGCFISIEQSNAKSSLLNGNWEIIDKTDTLSQSITENGKCIYAFVAMPQVSIFPNDERKIRFVLYQEKRSSIDETTETLVDEMFDDDSESDDETVEWDGLVGRRTSLAPPPEDQFSIVGVFDTISSSLMQAATNNETMEINASETLNTSNIEESPTLMKLRINTVVPKVGEERDSSVISRQYHIHDQGIVIVEDLAESPFSNDIPRQVLEHIIRQRTKQLMQAKQDLFILNEFDKERDKTTIGGMYETLIDQIQDEGDMKICRLWFEQRITRIEDYVTLLRRLRRVLVLRERKGLLFKASTEKKNPSLRFLPVNLHLQEMFVAPERSFMSMDSRDPVMKPAIYDSVTVGAMAAHVYKFKNGGLLSLQMQRNKGESTIPVARVHHPLWSEAERKAEELEWQIALRMDVCLPQAIAALVTSFSRKLDLSLQRDNPEDTMAFLNQLSCLGFIYQVESLLSTQGSEVGMLEDMTVAINELRNVRFLLVRESRDSDMNSGVVSATVFSSLKKAIDSTEYMNRHPSSADEDHGGLVIRFNLHCTPLVVFPNRLSAGGLIEVTPLLFTQGINEKQTLVNTTGSSVTQLQDEINESNLRNLRSVVQSVEAFQLQYPSDYSRLFPSLNTMKQYYSDVEIEIKSALTSKTKKKRPKILQLSADLCRDLGAGRVTVCKSAKDRTSMSVTLEQGRLLKKHYGLSDNKMMEVVSVMRSSGVRMENALKNTGRRMYAFNALQRSLLPEEYRCPTGTGGKNVS